MLAVELPEETVEKFLEAVRSDPEARITVDLEERIVKGPGVEEGFEIDDFTRHRLLNGLDDIALTLTHEDDLEAFEQARPSHLPSVR